MFPDWVEDNATIVLPLGIIYLLLIVASVVVGWLSSSNQDKDYTSLRERIGSWWVMVTIFAAALLLGGVAAIALFALISFLALKEYLTLIPARSADRRIFFWAFVSIPAQYYFIYVQSYGMFIVLVPVYFFLAISIRALITGQTEGFIRSVGTIHWGLMITVYCLGHLAYLYVLPDQASRYSGGALVLYVVLLTQSNDVFQFLWGKTLGRRKVAPNVSPNKTWGGLLGGVATTTTVAALIGPWMTPMTLIPAFCSGLIIATGGFFGDLLLSSVKRDLGVKDTGALLPGHGGILDRVDSLTVTAPLMLHFLRYFYFS